VHPPDTTLTDTSKNPAASTPRGSVRTQLVVTNIAALTLLLGILGVIIHYAVASTIMASVDRQLETRTHAMAGMHPPGPPHFHGFDHGPWHDHGPRPEDGKAPNEFAPGAMPRAEGEGARGAMPIALDGHADALPAPSNEGLPSPERGTSESGRGAGGEGSPPPSEPGWAHGPGGEGFPHPPTPADAREFKQLDKFRPRRFGLDGHSADPFPAYTPWSASAFHQSKGGQIVLATIDVDGEPYRMISAPYPNHGPIEGVMQDVYPLDDVERALRGVDRVLLTLSPVALLLAGLAGWILTGRVLTRVRGMTLAAAHIGAEDFSRRIPISGRDEFSQLGETFNSLLGRLETALDEQRKLNEQQRRFTADASHELKTPLTIIKGNTDMALSGDATVDNYRDALQEIRQASGSMDRLVRDLLLLARADAGRLAQSPIELLVDDVLQRAASGVRRPGAPQIHIDIPAGLTVSGNEDELTRLFTNLLDNSVRHTPETGRVDITATVHGDFVRIVVTDTGSGIDPTHLPHLGERFYRVDTARARIDGGTGLGLSICQSIAHAHGGSLSIESEPGHGTRVTVNLPKT
jgi:signal transduction histidine kinase